MEIALWSGQLNRLLHSRSLRNGCGAVEPDFNLAGVIRLCGWPIKK